MYLTFYCRTNQLNNVDYKYIYNLEVFKFSFVKKDILINEHRIDSIITRILQLISFQLLFTYKVDSILLNIIKVYYINLKCFQRS